MNSSAAFRPTPTPIAGGTRPVLAQRLRAGLDGPFRLLRRSALGIRPDEVSFARRGFRWTDAQTRAQLERVGQTFVRGYHAALDDDRPAGLARRLTTVEPVWRGFAFEGAAMALVLRDCLAPWRTSRFAAFVAGPGAPHGYMMLVGAGWALARLRRSPDRVPTGPDPLLRWLVADGYGFHEAYFHTPDVVTRYQVPSRLSGYAQRVFDQGVGRALWFVKGADPTAITAAAASFPAPRQPDLWSGIGLACAYAGGVGLSEIAAIRRSAGRFRPELAQGAAFAAEARLHAGNMTVHTEVACQRLSGLSAPEAAALVNQARLDLPPDGHEPSYEVWRRRIRQHVREEVATA